MITFDPRDVVELCVPRYARDPKAGDPKIRFRVPTRGIARRIDDFLDRVCAITEDSDNDDARQVLLDAEELLRAVAVNPEQLDDALCDTDLLPLLVDVRHAASPGSADRGN